MLKFRLPHFSKTPLERSLIACTALLVFTLYGALASAQIKQPGAHVNYSTELEPHGVILWDGPGDAEGLGFGFRAAIPLFHNGPIPKINNNMAIGFGFDWAFYENACAHNINGVIVMGDDCSGWDLWLPVVAQWNFYLTPGIAVFGEPGFAIMHRRLSYGGLPYGTCTTPDGTVIECDDYSDTDPINFIIFFGAKFFVSRNVSVTVRLGFPSISVGASFFL